MLQHNKKGDKSQPNTFVDGIHVKISEQYKPPRRIILPVSCQNCTPGEALYSDYDFRLEENVLNKLAEWKSARREQLERRKERLKAEIKVCEEIEHFSNVSISSSQNEEVEQTHQSQSLNHKLTDSVLTPTCAKQNSPLHKPASSNFNLSDFESDNSSPFDNMELKTINDMEVLATILTTNNLEQSLHYNNNNNNNNNNNVLEKELGKNCLVLNNKNTEWGFAPLNGYNSHTFQTSQQMKDFSHCGYYPISENIQISNYGLNDFSNQFGAAASLDRADTQDRKKDSNDLGKKAFPRNQCHNDSKSVPDIMLELEKELLESREREDELERRNKLAYLKEFIMSSNSKDKRDLPESSRKIESGTALSKLPDPTPNLSQPLQKLVGYISEMGFPIPRVARACEMFDGNDRKILEFLVQVQSLEEKSYPGDLVERALIINKFKLPESIKYLEAMVVLLDLGFDEERAEEALIAANSDRDKALDILIS